MAVNSEVQEIAEIIKDVVPTDRIYLFGSYAYGTPHKYSDYDFYVVLADETLRAHDAHFNIRKALSEKKMFRAMDIIILSASRFDDRSKLLTLERKVINDGVLLYKKD